MSLTLRQMRYFEAVAREKHFGRAAESVHVSQPALSAQIAAMEQTLGVQLVERSRSGALVTRKGEDVLERVKTILEQVDQLADSTRGGASMLDGPVRIGIIPTVAPYLVPKLVPCLRQRHPGLELELKEAVTDKMIVELQDGRLDAVIAALPIATDGLETQSLFVDRFYMAVANNNDTILMSPMTETQVDADRLLLLEEGHCLREQALSVCGTARKRSLVNFGATSMATLLQMVSHDMGMTLIPEMAIPTETARNDIRILPFAEPAPSREIGLIWRRSSGRRQEMKLLAAAVASCAPATA
ncbi:MAG TPA: LysR substrate-binding domain-containing protein [Pseudorhizobium sp.]|jgi:LysR family hydrogen peroxide-inducible transcriptional activator|nr:LysR substrate-binding domain-containing protein [Pseudorhizobium sp.]